MTNLNKNIDHYMKMKGIKKYSDLLLQIAKQLGVNGSDEKYKFVEREKANFSKMLKGVRPLKYDYIIPLEKIFGVSLARLLNEDAYKLPVEKENVPFIKGLRYYAYKDDPELYKKEFDLLLASSGKSIITETDEFGKTFLDYLVEYNSINGVRYLYEEYGIKLQCYHNQFKFTKDKGETWINFQNAIEFARLVASMHDAELFFDIYDSYYMFYTNGHYGGYWGEESSIFYQPDYLEIILDNEELFENLFKKKEYEIPLRAKNRERIKKTYTSINPIINNCLHYALDNLDKYKHRAIKILEFGINYNKEVIINTNDRYYIRVNELGAVRNLKDDEFYVLTIFTEKEEVKDEQINNLIQLLPKFNSY